MDVVVIGCGNPLRGDDGAGPEFVRRLAEGGLPAGVRCVDAGTGGIDAVLTMRGAAEVILVDACRSESPPGTLHEVSGEAVAGRPAAGIDIHAVRWDHALALARDLFGSERPRKVTAWLVEAESFAPGAPLSPAVVRALDALVERLRADFARQPGDTASVVGEA